MVTIDGDGPKKKFTVESTDIPSISFTLSDPNKKTTKE